MAINCSISNINCSEGIGTSILTILKGAAQLGTSIVDSALGTNFGVTEIGALAIMFMVIGWAVLEARKLSMHSKSLF